MPAAIPACADPLWLGVPLAVLPVELPVVPAVLEVEPVAEPLPLVVPAVDPVEPDGGVELVPLVPDMLLELPAPIEASASVKLPLEPWRQPVTVTV